MLIMFVKNRLFSFLLFTSEYSVANPEPVLSKFVPEEGHNICRLNSEQVTSLSENLVSRPGVVVSLKPEEVSLRPSLSSRNKKKLCKARADSLPLYRSHS